MKRSHLRFTEQERSRDEKRNTEVGTGRSRNQLSKSNEQRQVLCAQRIPRGLYEVMAEM